MSEKRIKMAPNTVAYPDEHGLLRVEVPFKDPMEEAVKVVIKTNHGDAPFQEIKPATV